MNEVNGSAFSKEHLQEVTDIMPIRSVRIMMIYLNIFEIYKKKYYIDYIFQY